MDSQFNFVHREMSQNAQLWRWEHLPLPWDDIEPIDSGFPQGDTGTGTPNAPWMDMAMESFLRTKQETSTDATILKKPHIDTQSVQNFNLPR